MVRNRASLSLDYSVERPRTVRSQALFLAVTSVHLLGLGLLSLPSPSLLGESLFFHRLLSLPQLTS